MPFTRIIQKQPHVSCFSPIFCLSSPPILDDEIPLSAVHSAARRLVLLFLFICPGASGHRRSVEEVLAVSQGPKVVDLCGPSMNFSMEHREPINSHWGFTGGIVAVGYLLPTNWVSWDYNRGWHGKGGIVGREISWSHPLPGTWEWFSC